MNNELNDVTGATFIARRPFVPSADGSNGPMIPVVAEGLPDATIVHRRGEINAWQHADFVAAVKKTVRKKPLVDHKVNSNESTIRTLSTVSSKRIPK